VMSYTRRSMLTLACSLGAASACTRLSKGSPRMTKTDHRFGSLILRPASTELWDKRAVHYEEGETLITEVLPEFSRESSPMHYRSLLLSDAVPFGEGGFRAGVEMAVECHGTEKNPFGLDPGDPRLAAGALVLIDYRTGLILDFFASNSRIWALYERMNYAALRATHLEMGFSSPVSVPFPGFTTFAPTPVTTKKGAWHSYEIAYDKARDRLNYFCDGKKVYEVDSVGAPIHQAKPLARLDSIAIGGGIFVVLDDLRNDVAAPDDTPRIPGVLKRGESGHFGQGARVKFRNFYVR
jgi:hypothetical protein